MRLKLKVNWRRNYSLIRDQSYVNNPLDFQNEKIIIENYEYGEKIESKAKSMITAADLKPSKT